MFDYCNACALLQMPRIFPLTPFEWCVCVCVFFFSFSFVAVFLIDVGRFFCLFLQICEIKLSPLPFISSHQGSVHLKISYVDNDEECVVYKDEVPDTRKLTNSHSIAATAAAAAAAASSATTTTNQPASTTNTASSHPDGLSNGSNGGVHSNTSDGIVITLDSCKALSGDIKVEFYMKPRIQRKKTLFSFWFNTYFVSERENDGKYESVWPYEKFFLEMEKKVFFVCVETNFTQWFVRFFFFFLFAFGVFWVFCSRSYSWQQQPFHRICADEKWNRQRVQRHPL